MVRVTVNKHAIHKALECGIVSTVWHVGGRKENARVTLEFSHVFFSSLYLLLL